MARKYSKEEAVALLKKALDVNEYYRQAKLSNEKIKIEDVIEFYNNKQREETRISLEARIQEPSFFGKLVVVPDTEIDGFAYEIAKAPLRAIAGALPERYRKWMADKIGEDEEECVSFSAGTEIALGGIMVLGSIAITPFLAIPGVYAVIEGIIRGIKSDYGEPLPSLAAKVPLSLIEKIKGPLVKEEKVPALENLLKLEAVTLPERQLPAQRCNHPYISKEGNNYIFSNVPHFKKDVEVFAEPLDHYAFRIPLEWWQYSLNNSKGIVVPSLLELYQLLHTAHVLKDYAECREVAEEFLDKMKSYFKQYSDVLITSTKLNYFGLKAEVEHLLADRTVLLKEVIAPKYTILSVTNAEKYGAMPLLESLLGEGCENADDVLNSITFFSFFGVIFNDNVITLPPLEERQIHMYAKLRSYLGIDISLKGDKLIAGPAIGIRLR